MEDQRVLLPAAMNLVRVLRAFAFIVVAFDVILVVKLWVMVGRVR